MTRRRHLLVWLAAATVAPRTALAQQPGRHYRIGYLGPVHPRTESYTAVFEQRLRELGFAEGRNLAIEVRTFGSQGELLPKLAAELARLNCDVLIAPGAEVTLRAMKQTSRDTPIVAIAVDYDLDATGHVDNLSRPGGRITGVTNMQTDLPAKRLQIIAEILPRAKRIAVLADVASAGQLDAAQSAARQLGLMLQVFKFERAPYDLDLAFRAFSEQKAQALLALGSQFFVPARKKITDLALSQRLPSIFHHSLWAEFGGLVSYGPSFADLFRRAAEQVVMIFKGTKPAEMPVEQPTRLELVLNLRTAKAIGITIPQSIMLRADRAIE